MGTKYGGATAADNKEISFVETVRGGRQGILRRAKDVTIARIRCCRSSRTDYISDGVSQGHRRVKVT